MDDKTLKSDIEKLIKKMIEESYSNEQASITVEDLAKYVNSELGSRCQTERRIESLIEGVWKNSDNKMKKYIETSVLDECGEHVMAHLYWISMSASDFLGLHIKEEVLNRANVKNNIYFDNKADAERFLKDLQKFILKNYPRARVENWYKDLKYENIEKDNTCGIELHLDIRM